MPPEPGHLWLSEESPHVQRGLGASAGCALNPVRVLLGGLDHVLQLGG